MGVTLRRGTRLVIASHNEGKVREIADLLAPFGVEAVSAGKLGLPEPEETGDSFVENARLKAAAAARDLTAAGARRRFQDWRSRHLAARQASIRRAGAEQQEISGSPWSACIASSRLPACQGLDRQFHLRAGACFARRQVGGVRRQGVRHAHVAATRRPAVSAMIRSSCRKAISETFGEMEPSLKDSISHRARAFEKLMLAAYDHD